MKRLTKKQTQNMIKWMDAMMSGDYYQTATALYVGRGYEGEKIMTAFGVACDVLIKGRRWVPKEYGSVKALHLPGVNVKFTTICPPMIDDLTGISSYSYLAHTLDILNDQCADGGYSDVLACLAVHICAVYAPSMKRETAACLRRVDAYLA